MLYTPPDALDRGNATRFGSHLCGPAAPVICLARVVWVERPWHQHMSTDKAARLQRAGRRGGRQAGAGRRRGGRVSLRAVGALIDELLALLLSAFLNQSKMPHSDEPIRPKLLRYVLSPLRGKGVGGALSVSHALPTGADALSSDCRMAHSNSTPFFRRS